MILDTNTSVWLLWFYQFAFVLFPGIAFLAVTIGVYLIYEFADRILSRRVELPVRPGLSGLPDIAFGHILAAVLLWAMRTALGIGVAFIGIVVIFLLNWLREPVQNTARQLEGVPAHTRLSETQWSTDFILLISLFGIGVSLVSTAVLYASFRRMAQNWLAMASSVPGHHSEPLFVRLFGELKFSGLVVMFVIFYPVLGIVMQIIWATVLFVPLPGSVTEISFAGSFPLVIWFLAIMWLLMIAALASPVVGLLRRWFQMALAHYRSNWLFRAYVNALFAFSVGLFGLGISMTVQPAVGKWIYPTHYSWFWVGNP